MNFSRRTVLLVALVVVVAAFMVVPIGVSDVIDSPFGQWKIGIRAIGTDGSTMPLSVVNTIGAQLLSVSQDGVEVDSVEFFISAKATGEGYTECEIDMTKVDFVPIMQGACSFDIKSGEVATIDVGSSTFTEIFVYTLDADDIKCDSMDPGTYTLSFEASGTVTYKGLPDGTTQTISSIPGAEVAITIDAVPPDDDDPPPECTWEYEYEYGSWEDIGCIGDGKMKQIRDRIVYDRYRCPDEESIPPWTYAWTDNQYRTISDSSCNAPDPCVESITYGAWTNWIYDRCEGATRYDYRTRQVTTILCPGETTTYSTQTEWRHYIDKVACSQLSIVKISPIFSVIGSVMQGSYYVDSDHYLGTRD